MPISSPGSVTHWIGRLQAGDKEVAQHLWDRYFQQLVGLARKKLRGVRLRAADEEDVALSALDSFCRGAARGRFPQLTDRNNLWGLLVAITVRKSLKLQRHERARKRGGGDVRGESALVPGGDFTERKGGFAEVLGREPTPEAAAQVAEECRRLLDLLGTEELRAVALWKMEGYTNVEIAGKLGRVEGTVERKLRIIRSLWEPVSATKVTR